MNIGRFVKLPAEPLKPGSPGRPYAGKSQVIEPLLDACKDSDSKVREAASRALEAR